MLSNHARNKQGPLAPLFRVFLTNTLASATVGVERQLLGGNGPPSHRYWSTATSPVL